MDDELLEMLETVLCNEDGSPLKLLCFLDRLLAKQGNVFVETPSELEELEKVAHRVLLLNPKQGWSGEKQLRFLMDLLTAKKYANALEPGVLADFRRFQEIGDPDAMLAEQAELKAQLAAMKKRVEQADQNDAAQEVNRKNLIEANQKLAAVTRELTGIRQERDRLRNDLGKMRQERDEARRKLEEQKKTREQNPVVWDPVIPSPVTPSPVIPKPVIPKERSLSEFAPDPKAFVIASVDDIAPCNAGSVRVEKLERTQRYLFSELYELRRVDFAESVKEIARFTIYECSPVELIIRNRDCQILSNKQSAFSGTEVLRIIAPAGGAVEAYARRENIPFVPLG